jgi:hypothetical protein
VLITLLVAGSDNHVDEEEREWAQKLVEFRSMRNDSDLVEYYLDVEKCWESNFQKYAGTLIDHNDTDLRGHFNSEELQKVNPILKKLPHNFSKKLYQSYLSYAEQVARASGGVFGFGSISPEEKRVLNLSMIESPVQ